MEGLFDGQVEICNVTNSFKYQQARSYALHSSPGARIRLVDGQAQLSCSNPGHALQIFSKSSVSQTSSSESSGDEVREVVDESGEPCTLRISSVLPWRAMPAAAGRDLTWSRSMTRSRTPETRQRKPSRASRASFSALSLCWNSSTFSWRGRLVDLLSWPNRESAPVHW